MIFLSALIGAFFQILSASIFSYYLAAIFVAFAFTLFAVLLRQVSGNGN